jgi:glycosyltransferase involved in cell wall biosynthesis
MHASPRKNVETILAALALPGLDGWTLTVLADLDHPANGYTRFLAERVRALGLGGRVRSEGYIRDPGRLAECMLEHDIYVTPSRIESWSHTVVEALAMGMPVVASDIACHREVAAGSAWLVGVEDAAGLAAAALEIEAGGDGIEQRLDRGVETVAGYSWDRHAAEALRALRFAAVGTP